jgi:hypothetical protein
MLKTIWEPIPVSFLQTVIIAPPEELLNSKMRSQLIGGPRHINVNDIENPEVVGVMLIVPKL